MNYTNFLREFYRFNLGQSELPNEDFDSIKNYFKILYHYPTILKFNEEIVPNPNEFSIFIKERKRHYDSSVVSLVDLKRIEKDTFYYIKDTGLYISKYDDNNYIIENHENTSNFDFIKHIIMVIVQIHPELTMERVSEIFQTEAFQESLVPIYEFNRTKKIITAYLKPNFIIKIDNTKDLISSYERDIKRTKEDILSMYNRLDSLEEELNKSYILLESYIEQSKLPIEVTDEEVHTFLSPFKHYLIDKYSIEMDLNRLIFKITTKPIPLTFFNHSPKDLVAKEWGSEYKELFHKIYENTDPRFKAFYSPYEITFIYRPSSNEIINYNISPIYTSFRNPHEDYKCLGNFERHLKNAREEGDINRFINIILTYLQTTTIGDVAGNKFLNKTVLYINEEGEEPTWENIREYRIQNSKMTTLEKFQKLISSST